MLVNVLIFWLVALSLLVVGTSIWLFCLLFKNAWNVAVKPVIKHEQVNWKDALLSNAPFILIVLVAVSTLGAFLYDYLVG